ncbi:MAG: methylated-DNA--[protein]-cysteine S-methyltransferase [Deltaproteobacteria bacterium]
MTLFVTKRETPIGEVVAYRNERGLVSMGFAEGMKEAQDGHADPDPAIGAAIDQYFAGSSGALDSLVVDVQGTALQRRIWRRLRSIPPGETRSYGELGAEVGTSGRVVGNAMAANPVCLALPCHRVIRGDGTWHGYAYGNDRKRWLLTHEANVRTPSGPADPLGE